MSQKDNVQGGAFVLSRSIFDSDIWFMPPHYLKIWVWLVGKATHKEKPGKRLKRGQCLVTIPETIEATKWKVGYRHEKLTKKQVWGVYEWLREENMIVTTKVTRGMIVTICNYDFYQDLSNYEGNNEGTMKGIRREQQGNTKDKNDKNERMQENIYTRVFEFWNEQKITIHKTYPPPSNGRTTLKTAINNLLRAKETEDTIKQTILNYNKIVKSKDHYFSHKWGLVEFLVRGFYKFNDWDIAHNNYIDHSNNGKPNWATFTPKVGECTPDGREITGRIEGGFFSLIDGTYLQYRSHRWVNVDGQGKPVSV